MTLTEKRRLKYPDTKVFHYHNANPKNKVTTDCVIRAICTALEESYEKVTMELASYQCKTGLHMADPKCYGKYMESKGWVRVKQPKKYDGRKYTGAEFCNILFHPIYSEELGLPDCNMQRILANIGTHHAVAIMGGQIWDIWDSSDGAIGQVWVKPY